MADMNTTQMRDTPSEIRLIAPDGTAQVIDRPMVAGRSAESDLVVKADFASRRHAQLTPGDGGLQVADLGSSNGTYHNGERKESFTARHGDTIDFDTARYRVEIIVAGASAPAVDPDVTRLNITPTPSGAQVPQAEPAPQPEPASKPAAQPEPPAQAAPKAERAWWETSSEGPDRTQLIQPGSALNAEMTQLLSIGAADKPRLVGKSGTYASKIFDLKEGKTVIGRDAQCDIVLDDAGVSTKHAQLVNDGGAWKLVNLLASNGTFVNGERIQTAYLNSGDEIRFGALPFMFQLPEGQVKQTAQPAAGKAAVVTESGSGKKGLIAVAVGFVVVLGVAAWVLL